MDSLLHYSSLTNTVSLSYEDLKKTIEAEEYADYIPDAWAGLIKVDCYAYKKKFVNYEPIQITHNTCTLAYMNYRAG